MAFDLVVSAITAWMTDNLYESPPEVVAEKRAHGFDRQRWSRGIDDDRIRNHWNMTAIIYLMPPGID